MDFISANGSSMSLMSLHVVLHVDDEPTDVFLVRRAFAKAQPGVRLMDVPDGEQAIHYLSGTGTFADRAAFPLPELVLLDIKMPLMDGFEVLSWMKAQQQFRQMPVIVLTSSSLPEDRIRAKHMGATGYIVKSESFEEVVQQAALLLTQRPQNRVAIPGDGPHHARP